MTTERAIRSDFLVHWTGKDIDAEFDPDWYDNPRADIKPGSEIAHAYLARLRNIVKFGLWLTEEGDQDVKTTQGVVTIPSTPKVCFTELKLSESRHHAKRYGRLGIGFKRPYLFRRNGRPLAYFGFGAQTNTDELLSACASDLRNKTLLNYFKPMNSGNRLTYDYYSESEWRILFSEHLLRERLILDPREPGNAAEKEFFDNLKPNDRKRLRYLAPLDGWFALIIYPSFWLKNIIKQDQNSDIEALIHQVKSNSEDHGNRVEGGNWPMEIDLAACRHF